MVKLDELGWSQKLWHFVESVYSLRGKVANKVTDTVLSGRERRLWDDIRVDLLTSEYAIEIDWAGKYAEGIGQALLYSEYTGKQPGIILLVEDFESQAKFIYRCKIVCTKYDIMLWLVDTQRSEVIDHTGIRYPI